jgi:hypothetical protein
VAPIWFWESYQIWRCSLKENEQRISNGGDLRPRQTHERSAGYFYQQHLLDRANWSAAALATIKKHRQLELPKTLVERGERVRQIWSRAASKSKIKISGMPPLPAVVFDYPEAVELKTLVSQLLLERGYLATTAVYTTYAHTAA